MLMPTVFSRDGFRFFFYSNEGNEPVHTHVEKGSGCANYWMLPAVSLNYADGFTRREIRRMTELVEESKELILEKWEEYFGE